MPTTSVRRRSFLVQSFLRVVRPDLLPVLFGEPGEGEHVRSRLGEQLGGGSEVFGELFNDAFVLGPHRVVVGLGEDRADQGGDHRLGRARHAGQQVA
jgi:hypothetical protein